MRIIVSPTGFLLDRWLGIANHTQAADAGADAASANAGAAADTSAAADAGATAMVVLTQQNIGYRVIFP